MAKYEIKDGVGIIPEGTTAIEREAFKNCTELTSIVIPDSVTKIGFEAFSGCTGLQSIVIPDSVTAIQISAFSECTGLTSAIIGKSVKTIDNDAFSFCAGLTSIDIPESVEIIGKRAFSECTGLTSAIIGKSVKTIDNDAFSYCTGLTSIDIPESVEIIGKGAFFRSGLESITIPKTVKKMQDYTFTGCNSLKSVTILAPIIVDYMCFGDCSALETVTLGVGIKKFHENAFENCTALKTIIVPAKKSDYYLKRLPESLHALVVEQDQDGPVKETKTKKATPTKAEKSAKKVYKVTFKCDCYKAICARFTDNAMPFDEMGYRMDFEQRFGKLMAETKDALFTSDFYDMQVLDEAGNQVVTDELAQDWVEGVAESWVEEKLGLESGNRYYIQGMQTRDEGKHYTFTKKITFRLETEQDFDVNKLKIIYDTKFDELYWNIIRGDSSGIVVDDIEPDEGLTNPYELYYDGKKVKANKISITRPLRGDAYMCFDWPKENK